jgi:2-keto-4-pentenoate hydratase/2-oxohepta-3-ene-1,7-dioic acid hydratase in catechol pathway
MKILTFHDSNRTLRLGIQQEDTVIDVTEAAMALGMADAPQTPSDFYRLGFAALRPLEQLLEEPDTSEISTTLDANQIKLGPAVPTPGKIICVGLNYRRHAEETGMALPTEPVLFSKFNNAITAPGANVELPAVANEYDYEAEMAFVIGRRAKQVAVSDALEYVLGYCNANDVSARDLQMRSGQWLIGKTLDGFLPVGPWLVTADEIADPQNLSIRCWRNGELVQDSNTADMIFTVAEIIAYASQLMTLEPGDLVITGTPEGVILGAKEKNWLQDGEETVVEVEQLGRLRNTFARV